MKKYEFVFLGDTIDVNPIDLLMNLSGQKQYPDIREKSIFQSPCFLALLLSCVDGKPSVKEHQFDQLIDNKLYLSIIAEENLQFDSFKLRQLFVGTGVTPYQLSITSSNFFRIRNLLNDKLVHIDSDMRYFKQLMKKNFDAWDMLVALEYNHDPYAVSMKERFGLVVDQLESIIAYAHSDAPDRRLCWTD